MAKVLSKVLTIRVPEREAKELADGAAARGICLSDYVRDLLRGAAAVERASFGVSLDSKEHELLGYMLAELVALRTMAINKGDHEGISDLFSLAKGFANSKLDELGLK